MYVHSSSYYINQSEEWGPAGSFVLTESILIRYCPFSSLICTRPLCSSCFQLSVFIGYLYMFPGSPVCLFHLRNELVGIIIFIEVFLDGLTLKNFFVSSPVSCRIIFIAVCNCTFIFFLLGTFCQLPFFVISVGTLCRNDSNRICSIFIMLAVMLIPWGYALSCISS